MVEVPEVAFPRSRGAYRAAPRVVRPRSRSGDPDLATRKRIRSRPLGLSEARGAGNRARIGLASELRCECTRPNCTEMLPGVAGTHRRAGQLVVAPAHFDGRVVARVADRFFVIEARGDAVRPSPREER